MDMAIYLGLDITSNYINQDEWERVFEETFKLIQSNREDLNDWGNGERYIN